MSQIQGFCDIKKATTTGISPVPISTFEGQGPFRVIEFGHDNCVLIVNREGTALATFDKCDVHRSFKCGEIGDVLTPPGMELIDQIKYSVKVLSREGGYVPLLKQMVIQHSLMKGVFNDSVLWYNKNYANNG